MLHALEEALSALPRWFDVDEPGNLVRLAESPVLPPRKSAWFAAR